MTDDPGSRISATTLALAADVVVLAGDWAARLPDHETLAMTAAKAALGAAGWWGDAELCVSLADDALLQKLNREYRGQDKPTNVLAFALGEGVSAPDNGEPLALGDVVLSLDTLEREAGEQGKSLADHFRHLVVHGCLHLIGFDHQESAEAEEMEALEVRVLAGLGVADPYAAEREYLGGAA
jgi:probable rRNA maturation factor